jgi:hypothetical protein
MMKNLDIKDKYGILRVEVVYTLVRISVPTLDFVCGLL